MYLYLPTRRGPCTTATTGSTWYRILYGGETYRIRNEAQRIGRFCGSGMRYAWRGTQPIIACIEYKYLVPGTRLLGRFLLVRAAAERCFAAIPRGNHHQYFLSGPQ